MIDLKRNSNKQPVPAFGKRVRKKFIYSPNQTDDFKISRGRFSDFLTCKRCFYLDRVKGLDPPGTPGWTLNETTDLLLKKEFDYCRERQIPHRIFSEYGLEHLVPFKHEEMDNWRNSLQKGLMLRYKETNIILTGGIDDIWQDTLTKELVIVDYKSQAKRGAVNTEEYLDDLYHDGYKIQMDFYAFLLSGMGFDVSPTAYFLVCNANRDDDGFNKTMNFSETLIPYEWNIDWIDNKVTEMIDLMNQHEIPESNECCKNCAYSDQYSKAVHAVNL